MLSIRHFKFNTDTYTEAPTTILHTCAHHKIGFESQWCPLVEFLKDTVVLLQRYKKLKICWKFQKRVHAFTWLCLALHDKHIHTSSSLPAETSVFLNQRQVLSASPRKHNLYILAHSSIMRLQIYRYIYKNDPIGSLSVITP